MVGDQKQLGPTFEYKLEGYKSLFTRLIGDHDEQGDSIFITLDT